MTAIGSMLMVSGWLLAMAALVLLSAFGQRLAFVAAAVLVEMLGLALIAQRHRLTQRGPA